MDLANFMKETNLFSLLLLLLSFLILIQKLFRFPFSTAKSLPPGPKPWPIIGNLHQMKKPPHIAMTQFAKIYGPLLSLRLGTQLLVVASSPEAAKEILKTHDRVLSARSPPQSTPYKPSDLNNLSLVWATGNNERFKYLRALFRTELFSAGALDSQAILREKKVNEMLQFLRSKEGEVINIAEIVFTTIFNILCNVFFSKDLFGFEKDGMATGLKQLVWKMMTLAATKNIADFYPILGGLDLQGLRKKALESRLDMFRLWEAIVRKRRERQGNDARNPQDLLDVFLKNGFTNDQINVSFNELFTAGTDTSTSTVEWALAELQRNKDAMEKLSEEISRETDGKYIKESRICQLPYLNACVKETLRLHPPVPFLIPHCALQTCEVMDYRIPKGTKIFVNVLAIGRDPAIWDDPLSFKPERFLGSHVDFKGSDFEFLPFGSGRRICPGMPMGIRQVHLVLASLVYHFNWSLPSDSDPYKLDMSEKFGITLQKAESLVVIPRRKL